MTVVRPERPKHAELSGRDLRGATFAPARGFGKGYDAAQVDAFVQECAALVERIETKHHALLAQLRSNDDADLRRLAVARSREAVAAAEKAGASIVARAQAVSEELRAEALRIRDNALATAGTLIRDAGVHSDNLLAQARSRAAALENETEARLRQSEREADARARRAQRDAETRLQQLQRDAERAEADVRSQTVQLVQLRDDIRVRMEGFLTEMLERVAQSCAAVDSSSSRDQIDVHRLDRSLLQVAADRSAGGLSMPRVSRRRHRRPLRLAGQAVTSSDRQILPAPRRGD